MKNDKEFVQLRHQLSLVGKRIMPTYLFSKNPNKLIQWGYNSCRQTAMFVTWYLKQIYPDRTVGLYEANFKDPYLGDAVHAFTFMKPSEDDMGLLVDVSRVSYPVLVEIMPELRNPGTILSNKMGYEITMESLVEVNWEELLTHEEFFTSKTYIEVCQDILKLLNNFKHE